MQAVLLWVHILAAGAWLGGNLVQVFAGPIMEKAGPGPEAAWYRVTVRMGSMFYTPAAIVALVTGFELVRSNDGYAFSAAFVSLGFFTVIVGAALGMVVFGPTGRKLAEAIDRGDHSNVRTFKSKLRLWGTLDTLLVVVTIYAMVAKI